MHHVIKYNCPCTFLMLYSTCRYGDLILSEDDREFHSFPSVKALAEPSVATQLQGMGFGYRSKFIQKSAAAINSKSDGVGWLYDLRSAPYEEAKSQLRTLHGVGAKVQVVKGQLTAGAPNSVKFRGGWRGLAKI